jgi:trans-aconitate 2-methyltransferase
MTTRAWDAGAYHRVSGPQREWAQALLDRLALRGDETVLDAGCGSGAVTAMLLERLPHGRVIAVDSSPEMVEHARAVLPADVDVRQADLQELALEEPVDAVFSNAVFHWVPDHPRLFARLAAALRPGGRVVAQCGGAGNVARFHAAARAELGEEDAPSVWNFAGAEETEARLRAAGFAHARCWLEPWPVTPDEPADYLRTVCCGPFLERLPSERHDGFVAAVLARLGREPTLDYVRLNITATR